MPASLLASMMPWRQAVRFCADPVPAKPTMSVSTTDSRTAHVSMPLLMHAPRGFRLASAALQRLGTFNDPARAGTIRVFDERAAAWPRQRVDRLQRQPLAAALSRVRAGQNFGAALVF